jgi:hypothetical protein
MSHTTIQEENFFSKKKGGKRFTPRKELSKWWFFPQFNFFQGSPIETWDKFHTRHCKIVISVTVINILLKLYLVVSANDDTESCNITCGGLYYVKDVYVYWEMTMLIPESTLSCGFWWCSSPFRWMGGGFCTFRCSDAQISEMR